MKLKRIGFSRFISREWLDLVARTMIETGDAEKAQSRLKGYFSEESLGEVARRKTLDVLSRIWIRVPEHDTEFRDRGLDLFQRVRPDERLWLHWGMIIVAYPVFLDIVVITGRLLGLQGEVTSGQIRRGIVSEWGDRTTLTRSVNMILQSMRDWRVLMKNENQNPHTQPRKIESENVDVNLWLIEAVLRAEDTTTLPVTRLERHPALFPFNIKLSRSKLLESKHFELSQQGLNRQMISLRMSSGSMDCTRDTALSSGG